jgi:hypothetical protein
MRIEHLGPGDAAKVKQASALFDRPTRADATRRFLDASGHHLLIAYDGDTPAGFVTGVEVIHPDKGTEMFLYELGVAEQYRRRGSVRPWWPRSLDWRGRPTATACGSSPMTTTAQRWPPIRPREQPGSLTRSCLAGSSPTTADSPDRVGDLGHRLGAGCDVARRKAGLELVQQVLIAAGFSA